MHIEFISKPFGKNTNYKARNRLEELMEKAANDPGERPEFYKQLFHFKLFVLGKIKKGVESQSVAFHIIKGIDDEDAIHAFTSKEALEYVIRMTDSSSQNFVVLNALDLFQMIEGKLGIMLNIGLSYGKYFSATEVSELLTTNPSFIEKLTLSSEQPITVGQPDQNPKRLLSALKTYLEKNPILHDLYFGLLQIDNKESSYLLVLKFNSQPTDPIPFINDLGIIYREIKMDRPVDMVLAEPHWLELVEHGSLISIKNQ